MCEVYVVCECVSVYEKGGMCLSQGKSVYVCVCVCVHASVHINGCYQNSVMCVV